MMEKKTPDEKAADIIKRKDKLVQVRKEFEPLIDKCLELCGKPKISEITKGKQTGLTLYDTTAGRAVELLGDGLHGNLFSPGWLKLKLPNKIEFSRTSGMKSWNGKRMDEIPEVASWLVDSQDVMHAAFMRSNFYSLTPTIFKAWGREGNVPIFVEENLNAGKTYYSVPHFREVYISRDRWGEIDGIFHVYKVALNSMVAKFGKDVVQKEIPDIENKLKNNPYEEFEILHAAYLRDQYDITKLDGKNKPWASCWIYNKKMLLESGTSGLDWVYFSGPRESNEWYGRSLVMNALVDIERANSESYSNIRAGNMAADPPYAMLESMRGRSNRNPGGNTYLMRGEDPPKALLDHLPGIPFGIDAQDRTDKIINAHLKTDVFMMMNRLAMENKNLTATQIVEMAGEKAAVISPITESAENGFLNPIIDIQWTIEDRAGRLPQPPQILLEYGGKIEVDCNGPLSQARRRFYKSQGIRAGIADVEAMATLNPEILDLPDWDKLGRYTMIDSFPADCIKSEEQVKAVRQQRAQMQQAEAVNQGLIEAAKAVPGLSKAIEPNSTMEAIVGGGS